MPIDRADDDADAAEEAGAAEDDAGDDLQGVRARGPRSWSSRSGSATPCRRARRGVPLSAYSLIRCRSTLMPARRAASAFEPMM